MEEQKNKMGEKPVVSLLASMSLPMMLSMLVQSLYNIVDSMYVSWMGTEALTAVSLAYPAAEYRYGRVGGHRCGNQLGPFDQPRREKSGKGQ